MQIGPRIRFDKHTLGNLVKNVSPALAFTPLGLAGVAGASALGDLGRGKHNLLDIAKSAAGNVAIGAGARGVAGHFGALGQGGAAPVPSAPSSGALPAGGITPAGVPAPAPIGGGVPDLTTNASGVVPHSLPLPGVPDLIHGAGQVAPSGGGIMHTLGNIGSAALDHDKTTAAVLGGLGNLGTMGAQNRQANAQTQLLEQQAKEGEYDYNQRKARDLALEPLRQALYGRLAGVGEPSSVARNPYTTAGA